MKKLLALGLSMAVCLGLAACGGQPAENVSKDSGAAAAVSGEKSYALIVKSAGNPYMEKMADGFKKAAEGLGASVIIKQPEKATAEAQITMVEELIAQKVAGIAIAGNDADALQPVLSQAMQQGIQVVSLDSAVNKDSRKLHVNQAGNDLVGQALVAAVKDIMGGSGKFAILSATSQATNQNAWIEVMKQELAKDEYKSLDLLEVAYGDDESQKSVDQTQALLKNYPDLKVICAPTTVGIAAAAKVLRDQKSSVKLTGLGLPSEMADYIGTDAKSPCPYMFLWNPIDIGSLAGYTLDALVKGDITGAEGETFKAGDMGEFKVVAAADGGTEVILGPPFKFDPSNIDDWKSVY